MSSKILIVDDSATIRHQLRSCLAGMGYEILEASNGALGVQAVKDFHVDMMIVDVNMPVMDGLEMLETVRETDKGKDIPVFFLTTESSKEMVARGRRAGATAWIVKPFKPAMLLKGVAHVLSQKKSAA